jgi:hypothetical protein
MKGKNREMELNFFKTIFNHFIAIANFSLNQGEIFSCDPLEFPDG